ncbi:MAG: MBL fold metallo-hydrolase [Candidatus Methanomethylicia archaeon]
MKIEVLGAAMEIGRSAIKLSTDNSKLLLDYGVLIHRDEPKFPLPVSSRDLNAILLTHAHLDHSGGIPLFYASSKPKLLTNKKKTTNNKKKGFNKNILILLAL